MAPTTSRQLGLKPRNERHRLAETFESEGLSRAYLEAVRWPKGVVCPRCGSARTSRITSRHQFDCHRCRYQFSVRTGTILHDSKLPLRTWLRAVYLLTDSPSGVSSNELRRALGVTYKTAWFLGHRIRLALADSASPELRALLLADDTYIAPRHRRGLIGSSPAETSIVVGAVRRGRRLRLEATDPGAPLAIDAFLRTDTESRRGSAQDRAVIGDSDAASVWSAFAQSLRTSHQHVRVKYISTYLDESAFRHANRANRSRFRSGVRRLLEADVTRYAELVGERSRSRFEPPQGYRRCR